MFCQNPSCFGDKEFEATAQERRLMGHFVQEYTPVFIERDLINLGVQEFYCKLSIKGEIRKAFSGRTLTLAEPKIHHAEDVRQRSRATFGVNLEEEAVKQAKQIAIESGIGLQVQIEVDPELYNIPFSEPFEWQP